MQVEELLLPGVKLVKTKIFHDDRGFFRETFRKERYAQQGIACEFVQDNHSFSQKGTIRGMHFQRAPGQAKLVSVLCGKIFDVVVDIRKNSPTYKQWLGVYLDGQSGDQLFVPVGYAHGFCALSETVHLSYKVSANYDPVEEKSFRFDDPSVAIQWPIDVITLSERDKMASWLDEVAL
ncbi:MAG TPA: dTDP-4-dehydrorhamnose 3,5-epimerase [Rhabdochlamydiaceae bacterium]